MEEQEERSQEERSPTRSRTKKIAAGAAAGVATAATVGVAKKLLGSDGEGEEREEEGPREHRSTQTRRSSASSRRGAQTKGRTKEELYAQAKRLKIEGRSTMSKAQLERAVERAKR